jgi:LAO/AO transport system kinase
VLEELVDRALEGEKRAIARLISLVENEKLPRDAMKRIYSRSGRAYLLGITGPSGCGKSTLIGKLIRSIREEGGSVGALLIDPSSPFSGGALLGDRIRMQELSLDKDVFLRSMATRGKVGGIARATGYATKILDASGKDWVIVETIGAGQSDLEIANLVYTNLLLLVPGAGDDIQAMKSGILEIADLVVINKQIEREQKNLRKGLRSA